VIHVYKRAHITGEEGRMSHGLSRWGRKRLRNKKRCNESGKGSKRRKEKNSGIGGRVVLKTFRQIQNEETLQLERERIPDDRLIGRPDVRE